MGFLNKKEVTLKAWEAGNEQYLRGVEGSVEITRGVRGHGDAEAHRTHIDNKRMEMRGQIVQARHAYGEDQFRTKDVLDAVDYARGQTQFRVRGAMLFGREEAETRTLMGDERRLTQEIRTGRNIIRHLFGRG